MMVVSVALDIKHVRALPTQLDLRPAIVPISAMPVSPLQDWNPHNDRQALARAHRLGQGREVMVYRFVTRATVEERMMECARRKLLLEHVVVQGMGDRGGVKQSELDEVLRHGTRELFAEEDLDRRAEEELAGRGSGEAGAGVDGLQGQPEARGGEGFGRGKDSH